MVLDHPRNLHPLTSLQIMNSAFIILRREVTLLYALALAGTAPLFLTLTLLYYFGVVQKLVFNSGSNAYLLSISGFIALSLIWRYIIIGAGLRALFGILSERPIKMRDCLGEAFTRWRPLVTTGGILLIPTLLSGYAFFIPGIFLGGLIITIIPLIASGEVSASHALAANREFTKHFFLKTLTVNILYYLIAAFLFFSLYLLVQLLLYLGRIFFDLEVSFLAELLSFSNGYYLLVLGSIAFFFMEPLRIITAGLLYLDIKIRREGLDLITRVEEMHKTGPKASPAVKGGIKISVLLLGALFFHLPQDARASYPKDDNWREAVVAMESDLASGDINRKRNMPRLKWLARLNANKQGGILLWRKVNHILSQRAHTLNQTHLILKLLTRNSSSGEARNMLRRIFTREEFDAYELSQSTAQRTRKRSSPAHVRLAHQYQPAQSPGLGGSFYTVVIVIVAAAVAGLAIYLLGLYYASRRIGNSKKRQPAGPKPLSDEETLEVMEKPPEHWRHAAMTLAAKGQYREALRFLYLAALVAMHRARAIEYDRSRTNWDYLQNFRADHVSRLHFEEMTKAFDYGWYGEREPDADTFDAFVKHTDELVSRMVAS